MTPKLRIFLIIASALTLLFFLTKISKQKMKIQYSVFWIMFGIFLLVLAVFPGIMDYVSLCLGVQSSANTVYLVIICLLAFKLFTTTLRLSQLSEQMSSVVHEMAIEKLDADGKQ